MIIRMSFSFGFTSESFSDDELNDDIVNVQQSQSDAQNSLAINPLDDPRLVSPEVIQPEVLDFSSVVRSLKDVRLTFETLSLFDGQIQLYRRELFDVKHQLMSESNVEQTTTNENGDPILEILLGDTAEDVRKNVYEGGLKSWECSIDIIELLNNHGKDFSTEQIFDMGCGTALPSTFVFGKYLQSKLDSGLNLILADYNKSVLELVTLPNLIITWAKTVLTEDEWISLQRSSDENVAIVGDELLLTTNLLQAFIDDLSARKIKINLISGSWGRVFSNLVRQHLTPTRPLLVFSSETIYQPENLPVVAETLLDLYQGDNRTGTKALVAAKDIYFGVGGSVIEFESYLRKRLTESNLPITFDTFKVNSNLKRSIVALQST